MRGANWLRSTNSGPVPGGVYFPNASLTFSPAAQCQPHRSGNGLAFGGKVRGYPQARHLEAP